MEIIDAWMQHPSAEFLADPVFDSLRRWAHGRLAGGEVPVAATVAAMDEAGVRTGMLCAWWGPRGPLISNDAVAAMVGSYPDRFAGVAAVDLAHPVEAVRELRPCATWRASALTTRRRSCSCTGTPNGSSACRPRPGPVRPASRTPAGKEHRHDGAHHP